MKLCPNCGKLNEDFAGTCSQCGSLLNSSNNNSEREYNAYVSVNEQQYAKTNGLAIASLVLGISSFLFACCCGLGIIPSILAIVFGFISKDKIKQSNGFEKGDGLALAGIILGFVGILFALISFVVSPAFWQGFIEGISDSYIDF
ncbi:MAG TPA: DUF4190 domain-containing protein [Hungateiclostridium thermocellum]|jgi:hypothetical protein|uniref:Uncharacterized protein n=2 Tax=Acetivibrio thermocellus TaxID=1515 RepID=A3DJU9_ACET2|nr:DUF4190 domain-containing protein [Acetivibrio thermocellus]ABN54228.1 hypothetical protein Cthe_3032 [Acetivibrio thermocellus ATCC 27405]ADU73665.1 hypothetical protein Clo1313_0583 [Acetivibrio thermocellus DSM 1313]ALX07594.1 protein of unknown function DUF4190 [Acetivibrio thermocellus AD2]ANV75334.1 protein of unknown function DUF4190 [Acetivibrio thermocellus DSM 2360]EIC03484.1 hypothetical protein YSBL_2799 [Acetivibrio thermocellus YS]